jgi:hypothetical protein
VQLINVLGRDRAERSARSAKTTSAPRKIKIGQGVTARLTENATGAPV